MDPELLAYVAARRRQVQAARESAVHQNGEWAADGALHELDRLESWLNLQRDREQLARKLDEVAAAPFVAEAER